MNINKKIDRKLCHTREVFSQGYRRIDGLYDIESVLTDTKSYSFQKFDGSKLLSGEPLHKMKICLTIDINLKIHNIHAETKESPYKICKSANFKIESLIGETISHGWKNKINSLIGRSNGCTHIRELMASMATVAFQTIFGEKSRIARSALREGKPNPFPEKKGPPDLLDSCYAYGKSSEITKKIWPDHWVKR